MCLQFPVGLLHPTLMFYTNQPWGLQLAPILRGAQQETPLASAWSLGGPADVEKHLDIVSAQSPFYTRLSANTKLKPDGTCTAACSGLPSLQLWESWREDPVECNTLSLWLPHVTLHSFSLNPAVTLESISLNQRLSKISLNLKILKKKDKKRKNI